MRNSVVVFGCLAVTLSVFAGEPSPWAEGADAYLRDCISLFEEYGWDWSYHAFREWSGWDVEKVCTKGARTGNPEFADAPDTPRKRVLIDGFRGVRPQGERL